MRDNTSELWVGFGPGELGARGRLKDGETGEVLLRVTVLTARI